MHVLHTFSNNAYVPYLTWFAEQAHREGGIRYTFIVMHSERPLMLEEMRALGFECHWIHYDDRKRKRGMLRSLPKLWRYMNRYKPDIVHCHLFDDSLPGLIAARIAGIKVRVITRQDTGFHTANAPQMVRFDRWNTYMATHVIAISGECRRFLIEQESTPVEKLHLVHNGIPPAWTGSKGAARMDSLRRRFGITDHFPVIGTVARFIEWKGHRKIVEAAQRLVQLYPKMIFLFCGTGPDEERVRHWIQESGLSSNVIITGWVDRSDMASFYGILDMYLHAAVLEPFGMVYPEAMMNSVPVVSTPTGAALDAIEDGVNGILVNECNADGLVDGIERLLRSDLRTIGNAGKETALRMFRFEVMWNGTMAVYRKALDPRS